MIEKSDKRSLFNLYLGYKLSNLFNICSVLIIFPIVMRQDTIILRKHYLQKCITAVQEEK